MTVYKNIANLVTVARTTSFLNNTNQYKYEKVATSQVLAVVMVVETQSHLQT